MTDLTKIIVALHNAGLVPEAELRKAVITALGLFQQPKHLFDIEVELRELCDYERAKP